MSQPIQLNTQISLSAENNSLNPSPLKPSPSIIQDQINHPPLQSFFSRIALYIWQLLSVPCNWAYRLIFNEKVSEQSLIDKLNAMSSPLTNKERETLSDLIVELSAWYDKNGDPIFFSIKNPYVAHHMLRMKPRLNLTNSEGKLGVVAFFELAVSNECKVLFGRLIECREFFSGSFDFNNHIFGHSLIFWAHKFGWNDLIPKLVDAGAHSNI